MHPNYGGSADVHGDEGNDTITAISASGVVSGDGNNDVITLSTMVNPPSGPASAAYGGAGNDRIVANRGTSVGLLDGGDGNDRISTDEFATAATLDGGAGKDLITTKNLTGGGPFPYAAQILGGAGPDTIDGGGAGDTLDCGPDVEPLQGLRRRHGRGLRDRVLGGRQGNGRRRAVALAGALGARPGRRCGPISAWPP